MGKIIERDGTVVVVVVVVVLPAADTELEIMRGVVRMVVEDSRFPWVDRGKVPAEEEDGREAGKGI